jgi:hypothetical protein
MQRLIKDWPVTFLFYRTELDKMYIPLMDYKMNILLDTKILCQGLKQTCFCGHLAVV